MEYGVSCRFLKINLQTGILEKWEWYDNKIAFQTLEIKMLII